MYNYLKGKVTEVRASSISYEVGGIGYELIVSNPYSFEKGIDKIYVYQHVREDEISLFGFKTIEVKKMFLDLISVKGIGPKTALAILAMDESKMIKHAIVNEDVVFLQKFPKIGKKAAQQIIIDLSGKYTDMSISTEALNNISLTPVVDNTEVIEALLSLGYKEKDVNKYLKLISIDLSTEEKIKEILRLIVSK